MLRFKLFTVYGKHINSSIFYKRFNGIGHVGMHILSEIYLVFHLYETFFARYICCRYKIPLHSTNLPTQLGKMHLQNMTDIECLQIG